LRGLPWGQQIMNGSTTLSILIPLISAAAGLIGVVVGSWLTDRRERDKQRRDYITRQLSELYGPLLSLRGQVTARHEFPDKVTSAIHKQWDALSPEIQKTGADLKTIVDLRTAELDAFTDHDQKALRERFMPDYQEMLTLMRKNMWLAEKSTRDNFGSLVEYVDTWDIFIKGVIRAGVVMKLGQGESKLRPFYTDIEEIHDRLRSELTTKQKSIFSAVCGAWANNILRRIRPPIP
jgi:hypothetical protein